MQFNKVEDMLWRAPDGGYVLIEPGVLQVITRYTQSSRKAPESGGLLAGYYKSSDLHITNLTVPLKGDKSGRYHFHRRSSGHIQKMKNWYLSSEGKVNCLGEWHTHPQSDPTPSSIDIKSWKEMTKKRNGLATVFLILGTDGIWVGSV